MSDEIEEYTYHVRLTVSTYIDATSEDAAREIAASSVGVDLEIVDWEIRRMRS